VQALGVQLTCPTLVGRARELDAVAALAQASAAGRCELVLVAGEAGVGKTRLLEEARERTTGVDVLWGACLEQQRALPYAPIAEALRHLPGALDDPVLRRLAPELDPTAPETVSDTDLERHRIAQALATRLQRTAEQRPLLVVLDDLQWADAATLDLLGVLVRRLADSPVLLLVSYRDDELHDRPALRATLADLRRGAHELTLTRLPPDQVAQMIRAMLTGRREISPDFVGAIHARTDGNPFFVEELLRTLVETGEVPVDDGVQAIAQLDVPVTVQDTILRRVARLDDAARVVLRIGAALGQRFDLEPVRRLSGFDEDDLLGALRALVSQQLLVEDRDSGELRFRHALTRDTVYGELLVAERRGLHHRVAEVLEDLHGASAAAQLSLHYEAAGAPAKARELALQAGRQAASLGAVDDARAHLATALRLTADAADRAEVLLARGRLSYAAGDLPASIAELREAADVARGAGDLHDEAHALIALATSLLMNGDRAGSLEIRLAALALLEPHGDSEELAAAYRGLGTYYMLGSSYTEAIAWSERALALAGRVGAEHVAVEARNDLGVAVALTGDPERGVDLLRGCTEAAAARGWAQSAARAFVNLSDTLLQLGRLDEAYKVSADGAAYCERTGVGFHGFICRFHVAECCRLVGRWEESERQLTDLLAIAEEHESRKYRLMVCEGLGALRVDQGRFREARALRDRLEPLAFERDELQHVAPFLLISARYEAAVGSPERARAQLERLYEYARRTDDAIHVGPALALACELAADERDRATSLERLGRAAAASPATETQALLAQERGDLQQAADQWAQLGRPYDRARALRRLGDRAALEQARAIFAELGADHERALAEAALRRAGVRVPRGPHARTRAAPGGLTARELQVARLVADGTTNADIARALVVAPKTAAAHVSHILGKLGFSSRAQIARWVAEHAHET
jgi:DNA-binding NarL/FixJ family response regulator/tetratricopeptide (TPR) repeat protein